jgi:Fibronectin type III domain
MGFIKVLGAVLFLVLFHKPVGAFGATLPTSYSVTLAWTGSTSAGVDGYRVDYGTTSGIYTNSIVLGNVTTNTVAGLAGGVTYFFALTTYDTNGSESPFSNEISYTVPTGLQTVGIKVASNRQDVLTVTGQTGLAYDVLTTQDFKTWSVIGTVTMGPGGTLNFIDTNAASFSKRFYRTQQLP